MEVAAVCLGVWLFAQLGVGGAPAELPRGANAPAALQPAVRPNENMNRVVPGAPQGSSMDALPAAGLGKAAQASGSGRKRVSSPEMVAEALTLPTNGSVTGHPLTVLQALSATPDRGRQLEITLAYWRLVHALANDRFCSEHAERISKLSARADAPAVRTASASAAAQLREAELEAVDAQYHLAVLMAMPCDTALPLPADRPHVGPYRTNFRELFAGRIPPERTRLLARVLPIWQRAIEDHAAAVQAAEDALSAVSEGQAPAPADASAMVACSRELLRQRRAFFHAVCDYNRNIAEYALAVAALGASPQTIAAMLVGPPPAATTPAASGHAATSGGTVGNAADSAVQPAALNEPVPLPNLQSPRNEPTLAPPRNEPTLAPLRGIAGKSDATSTPNTSQAAGSEEPLPISSAAKNKGDKPATPHAALVPVLPRSAAPALKPAEPKTSEPSWSEVKLFPPRLSEPKTSDPKSAEPKPVTANKPTLSLSDAKEQRWQDVGGATQSPAAAAPLYAGLMGMDPLVRAKQLTIVLHWDRSRPANAGKPMALTTCLMRSTSGDLRTTIEAFWRLRQRAAHDQVLAERVEWLESLMPAVLERRSQPAGPIDMLHLRAAQMSAKATACEAQAGLVEAQYALASRTGAVVEAAWPLAATPPHSGKYLLRLEAQPRKLVQSWPIRRLATKIPALSDSVQQHATAVVEADAARSSTVQKYVAGSASIEAALESIQWQTEQTAALLDTLTEYNLAIADYALAVLPAGTPADKLAAALVVTP